MVAKELLEISESGLKNRRKPNSHGTKDDETEFLAPLFQSIENEMSLSDEMLQKLRTVWGWDIKAIYNEYCY